MPSLSFYRPAERVAGWGIPMTLEHADDFDFRAGAAAPHPSGRTHEPHRALPPGWLA